MNGNRPKGRAKSCTRCRQAKLACDARKTLNGPCSRCMSKGFECRFDANFKRVSTRKLAEELSQDLHASRSVKETPRVDAFDFSLAPDNQGTDTDAITAGSSVVPDISEHSRTWLRISDSDAICSYDLGTVKLDGRTVIELFQYFHAHYHRHVTFLRPVISVSDLSSRFPLLFWTIVLVASQEHDQYAAIYHGVAIELEELLSPILRKAIQKIETIHALLLLCLWPVTHSQYFHNPAWNYAGLAINAAMQLHCHNPMCTGEEHNWWPGFGLVAEGEVSLEDQARTWLGCFRVASAVATFSGMPPPLQGQQHIKYIDSALCTIQSSVPSSWHALFSIIKMTNSSMDTLVNVDDHVVHFSLTQLLSDQMDDFKKANLDSWGSDLEIEWCNAKLYLFALTFTTPAPIDTTQKTQVWVSRHTILQKAFEVASSLITQFLKLSQQGTSDLQPGGLLKYVPELYFTPLFNATAILFRFMVTFVTPTPMQKSQVMTLIIEAHKIFQSYPTNREFTRAAIHIETLIDVLKRGPPPGMSELVVKNKLGASIMFDAIYYAARQRNIDPRTKQPLAVPEWRTVRETYAERLPKPTVNETVSASAAGNEIDIAMTEQDSQWWDEWDKYIDLFQIDQREFDMNTWNDQ